ncbi:MAG TPA: hypothetical protein VHE10_01935 [Candidatus Paceibacterota bacterium]|nr:hypothetical protein [Candidatus Paceibacterota bacterium]
MDIPIKVRVSLCIEQGSVFNFFIDHNDSKRQSKNRYFVVMNKNPKTDTLLILVTSTTQAVKKREFVKRAGISEKTIVSVTPQEYGVFSAESVFNCNEVFEISMNDLIRKIEDTGSMNYPKMDDGAITKIIAGIKESPSVSEINKKLL